MSRSRLDSWKSIAGYLERSPRTVQRWHKCQGLPVHHLAGPKGSVFAYQDEIDRWMVNPIFAPKDGETDGSAAIGNLNHKSMKQTIQALDLSETSWEETLSHIAGAFRSAIEFGPDNAQARIALANSIIASALVGKVQGPLTFSSAAEVMRRKSCLEGEDPEVQFSAA